MFKRRKDHEKFFESGWRPAVGWAFVIIILFDFVIAPGITMALIKAGVVTSPWVPLTMDGAGTFYLAIGAILGVAAWTRGQEKIKKIEYGYDFGDDSNVDSDNLDPPL